MNRVFVDTSAILALLVSQDRFHEDARTTFERLKEDRARLVTTSYVMLETYALAGRRLGLDAVRGLREGLAPLFEVVWVDESLHETGLDRLLATDRRDLSLVDALSLVVMERMDLDEVFAFDPHLTTQES